ncbi:MAG: type II toxin-antitoxin system HicB family antitoxin [Methylacidiphilales bacterium]|nr:type II toxin-antitoxin system HicB family antitoxin [Candidatus Methylacidiphilales bacterium]
MSRPELAPVVQGDHPGRPLADGGGFAAFAPDLSGCMSDGETPEEAIVNVQDAICAWIEAARDLGREVPAPSRHLAGTILSAAD